MENGFMLSVRVPKAMQRCASCWGKGANLAEMASIGLPVPPGFTITTEVCTHYYENGERYPDDLEAAVAAGVAHIEQAVGAAFGDRSNPLWCRCAPRACFHAGHDGYGAEPGLTTRVGRSGSGQRRCAFAYDSYRRFIQMYGDVVLGVDHAEFEDLLEAHKDAKGVYLDTDMDADDLRRLVDEYKDLVQSALGAPFPQDPKDQLWGAVSAVFGSWQTPRAVTYRRLHDIPEEWGTAVNVQAMVFGNMGDDCATGVAFTRDPSTGENAFYGEYLVNAQGEDVVAGIRIAAATDDRWQGSPRLAPAGDGRDHAPGFSGNSSISGKS